MPHWGFLGPTDAFVSLEYLNERIASWRLLQRICYRKKMFHWGFLGPTDAFVSLEYLNERIASWRLLIFVFWNEHGWCQQRKKKSHGSKSKPPRPVFCAHIFVKLQKTFLWVAVLSLLLINAQESNCSLRRKKCNSSSEEIHDTKGLSKHEVFVMTNSD